MSFIENLRSTLSSIKSFTEEAPSREVKGESDERLASLLRPLAFDPESHLFLLDGRAAAFGYLCTPLNGTSEALQERIKGLLQINFPADTVIQMCLFRSPDIESKLDAYRRLRYGKCTDPDLSSAVEERIRFLRRHTSDPLVTKTAKGALYSNGLVCDLKLIISVIVPIKNIQPSEEELDELKALTVNVKSAVTTLELAPEQIDADTYLRLMQTLCNWSDNARWKNNRLGLWEKEKPLSCQVFDWDTDIAMSTDDLRLGDRMYCRTLSAKQLPELYYFGSAMHYIGPLDGSDSEVDCPFAVCCNLYFPDRDELKSKVTRKRQFTVNQAFGPMAHFSPELMDKKLSFDILDESFRKGAKPLLMSFSVLVWGKTAKSCEMNAQNICNAWREKGFTLMVDKYAQIPIFAESLPFNADKDNVQRLFRYKTLTTEQAAVIIPLFGEWKGTGTPHLLMSSRNGQIMSFSLHDTGSNKNCVIAAQSGSGKSFFINDLIVSYLSEGAQIWVIDAGKSYKKLCEDFRGDFLQFDDSKDIRMNPFELIANYEDEEDTLVSLLLNMASMKGNLDDVQVTGLKRILNKLWKEKGNTLVVDDLAGALLESEDQRLKDLGSQLYPFTAHSPWGKYFSRGNNVSFKNRLTVLELDELQGRKHLRQVVLLQLIMQIQHEVYLGDRSRKKIVIVDEAWDLLKEGEVARFMEGAYRKFRKYNGTVVIATQSVNDLYENESGRAIAENSATMCLLGQKAESIERVREKKYLEMSEGLFQQLKTVHTIAGVYSEIFVRSEHGTGIYRLFVDDYAKLQYSTSPEDLAAIKHYTDLGLSGSDAIKAVLKDRSNPPAASL